MKTIIHDSISVELPFALTSVTKLKINQSLNHHSRAWLEGTIQDQDVKVCSNLSWRENVTITYENGKTNQIIFSGIPYGVKIKYEGQAYVSLEFCSRSMFMDDQKKTRSFQRNDRTYKTLFRELIKSNGGDIIDFTSSSDVYKAPLIQYEETDWEFLKRISSHMGVPVYPNPTGGTAQIYIGFGSNHVSVDNSIHKTIMKRMGEYLQFRKINSSFMESDFLAFYVNNVWNCGLGDEVACEGRSLRVTRIEDSYEDGLLSRRCLLEIKGGITRKKSYQKLLKGASLKGIITAVGPDRVRVRLDADEKVPKEKLYWYPWHRNDWFCIPEVGSKAALYIPGEDEALAYVTDIIRPSGKKNSKNQKPEHKCFVTKRGKGMEVTPHSIFFRASGKKMTVQLSDRSGVKIRSSRGIQINAGETFVCNADNIKIKSKEQIALATGSTSIVIDDLLQIKG
ncbi:hypothetical protein [Lacrimispora sp. JR3]|uniref:hypothetical protein n=1 Tax=Lacrimispora sinapis TaxID=3111456 RepID=UPI00374A0B85